jgi:hypothetical protein
MVLIWCYLNTFEISAINEICGYLVRNGGGIVNGASSGIDSG